MSKLVLIFVAIVAVAAAGSAVWLLMWDPPAPTKHIERTLDDSRFPG